MADPIPAVHAALNRLAGDLPALGVAISGGSDSTALLHAALGWANGRRIMAATVDHGLRPESAAEARAVHRACADLGVPHVILVWQRQTTAGNLLAQARDARLRLLSGWARHAGLAAVALGHTRDDQAETVILRLMRGSGVDGLSGMAEMRDAFDMRWLRPLLGADRAGLRAWLLGREISWIDDPSNENRDFDRIRVRQALDGLDLDPALVAQSAANLTAARQALRHYAELAAEDTEADRGTLVLSEHPFRAAPADIRRRILVAAVRWVTGADYPPRRTTLIHAKAALMAGGRVTLDGAIIAPRDARIRVAREAAAARRAPPAVDGVWDARWRVTGVQPGQTVAALGHEALATLPWRASGLPRDEAAATPAVFGADGRLVAAPVLRPDAAARDGIAAEPLRDIDAFAAILRRD